MSDGTVCICAGCRQLAQQLKIVDGAMAIALELAVAVKPLIPNPDSLSLEQRELWQKVVDAIFRAADYADQHNLGTWGGKISRSN